MRFRSSWSGRRQWVPVVVGIGFILMSRATADAGHSVYLSLGDSIAFGVNQNDTLSDISNGDRGYVNRYADYLANQAGGVRPSVINLAISGEASSSFRGDGYGTEGVGAVTRNTNYGGNPLPSQESLMLQTIRDQIAAGNTIDTVTLLLGANDFYLSLTNNISLEAATAAFAANEEALLGEIRGLLPSTHLILLNYYDPFAQFRDDPTSPFYYYATRTEAGFPAINQVIATQAQAFGASYVDVYSLFENHISAYTNIDNDNAHPNDAGYDVIAHAIESVPEPGSIVLVVLGCGLIPLVAGRQTNRLQSPRDQGPDAT